MRDTIIQYATILENEYTDDKLYSFGKAIKQKITSYEWFEKSFDNLEWSNHTEIFRDSKDKERVRLVLEIIEKYMSQRSDIGKFTIEHILPDSEGEQNAHIGNLIPLEQKLNEKCKTKKLEQKRWQYISFLCFGDERMFMQSAAKMVDIFRNACFGTSWSVRDLR